MLDKIPDFNEVARKLIKDAQTIAEVEMLNFVMSNFEKQGFTNTSFVPWQNRKGSLDPGRAILKKSGALQDKISISSSSTKRVVATANSKYAQIHNEGGTIKIPVTAKIRKYFWYMYKLTKQTHYKFMAMTKKTHFTIVVPQRQFMGDSVAFNNIIEQKFVKMINSRFKAA